MSSTHYGNSYIIVVDSNKDYRPGSVQYNWLIKTLSSQEAQSAQWLFVTYHHPAYSEGWNVCDYDGEQNVRNYILPLMEEYRVDIVFSGHMHLSREF